MEFLRRIQWKWEWAVCVSCIVGAYKISLDEVKLNNTVRYKYIHTYAVYIHCTLQYNVTGKCILSWR